MKHIDEGIAHHLLKDCGLTDSEAKSVLHNPIITMLILPILERIEQIEGRLNAKEG
jgi:hypothetical protein